MRKQKKSHMPNAILYKTIFQCRYKPQLKFFQLMFTAAQEFNKFENWEYEGNSSIVLKDYEKKCSLAIRHNHFAYDQDSGEREEQKEYIENVLKKLSESLEISSYGRVGFRRYYLIAVTMSFSELVALLNLKLMTQANELVELMPPQVDDLIYRVDSSDDDIKFHITVGPVQKKEIPRHISFNQNHHLDALTREMDYPKIIEAYPDVAVLIDIDIYKTADGISAAEALNFYRDAHDRMTRMVKGLRDYLFSRDIGE